MQIRRLIPWILALFLGALSLTLGYRGFDEHFDATGIEKSRLDLLYLDWQLFTMESGAVDGFVPIELEVARILSPLLSAWALWAVLVTLLRNHIQRFLVSFMRDHVVICGLGRTGAHLVQSCIEAGERVVALEPNEASPEILFAKDCGARVLCADATSKENLKKVNAQYAKAVIAVTGDDGSNIQIAMNAHALFSRDGDQSGSSDTTCFVQTMEYALAGLFKEHPIFVTEHDHFDVVVFNVYENVARRLLRRHALDRVPLGIDDPRSVHLVIIGLGQMGESILLQAAKSAHFANGRKLVVTVIDRDADRREKALRVRYPQIDAIVNLSFVRGEMSEPDTVGLLAEIAHDAGQLCSIAICLDQDSVNVQFVLHLDNALAGTDCPFYVRLADDSGLVALMDHASDRRAVHAFGMNSEASDWNDMDCESADTLARAIHEAYLAKKGGASQPEDPSTLPWAKLAPGLRDSNRQQADHIPVKLRALGYGMRNATGGEAITLKLCEEEIEMLARMEHSRWNAERALAGWRFGEKKDVDRKITPYLVPYDDLDQTIKDYDRAAVRNLSDLLALAKQEVYRIA